MKIGLTRAKLFHADGQIDRHDVEIRRFLQIYLPMRLIIYVYSTDTWKDLSLLKVTTVAICTIWQRFSF